MNILGKKAIRRLFFYFSSRFVYPLVTLGQAYFLEYADLVFPSLDQTCRGIVRPQPRKFLTDSFVYLHFIRRDHYAVTVAVDESQNFISKVFAKLCAIRDSKQFEIRRFVFVLGRANVHICRVCSHRLIFVFQFASARSSFIFYEIKGRESRIISCKFNGVFA